LAALSSLGVGLPCWKTSRSSNSQPI